MNLVLREPWTVERFLAWEDKQEGKHEFDGVRTIEMTGGSRAHQRIVHNLVRLLEDALDPVRFDAVPEMRVNVGGKVRYPDVAVVAGRVPDDTRTLRDAVVIFEVLSAETEATDRGDKLAEYALLPSLRRCVLVEQSLSSVTVLERTADGWSEAAGSTGTLDLPELGVALTLDSIYLGVRLSGG
jgi:Uma2 family endonuclease